MEWWHAILLGIVEGITEFLPVSSTGHLTIVEYFLGYKIDGADITAFTVIIQIGAIAAAVLYFWSDIQRVATAWIQGLFNVDRRGADYKYGWAIIIGSVPIAIVGLLFKDVIETTFRSLWFVAGALIVWSFVMWWADVQAKQTRHEKDVTWKDTLFIGVAQCIALIPGVSRSGATMTAGLMKDMDRVAVTRLSFFLGIPALVAAGLYQAVSAYEYIGSGAGWLATSIGTIVSFIVAYYSIDWLLKFVAKHSFMSFIWYRIGIGALLMVLLITGTIQGV